MSWILSQFDDATGAKKILELHPHTDHYLRNMFNSFCGEDF